MLLFVNLIAYLVLIGGSYLFLQTAFGHWPEGVSPQSMSRLIRILFLDRTTQIALVLVFTATAVITHLKRCSLERLSENQAKRT
jgi:hypothetical protein